MLGNKKSSEKKQFSSHKLKKILSCKIDIIIIEKEMQQVVERVVKKITSNSICHCYKIENENWKPFECDSYSIIIVDINWNDSFSFRKSC